MLNLVLYSAQLFQAYRTAYGLLHLYYLPLHLNKMLEEFVSAYWQINIVLNIRQNIQLFAGGDQEVQDNVLAPKYKCLYVLII